MKQHSLFFAALTLFIVSCNEATQKNASDNNRFFSPQSFWNQPIASDAAIDSLSDYYISLLQKDPAGNFGINLTRYTIPVFEVNDSTPRFVIQHYKLSPHEKLSWRTTNDSFRHGKGFDAAPVPIPAEAIYDTASDRHLALIDKKNRVAYDMWGAEKLPDGSWVSKTGMRYSLDGDGVFNTDELGVKDSESVHFHGPSRAAAVPAIAGLIMYDEVKAGVINHKIACATRFNAFKQFVYPAAWTDGMLDGGIPEGAVIQLDPTLDITQFNLLPGELAIAKALQQYGAVIVDWAGANVFYGENLAGNATKSWKGVVSEWEKEGLNSIPLKYYRVLKINNVINKGDTKSRFEKGAIPEIVKDSMY